jgi:ribosomal-protein-serine acetyltransferase
VNAVGLSLPLDEERRLRLCEPFDTEELHSVIEANREHLSEWMPWARDQTIEGTADFIERSARELSSHTGLQLAIVDCGAIVGVAGVHRLDWENRTASLGYWLAEEAQGRGTATLAARALAAHVFDVWRLNRVEIRAAVENWPSRALAERLGFNQEGVLRQAARVGERFVDHVVYALLASEWREAF